MDEKIKYEFLRKIDENKGMDISEMWYYFIGVYGEKDLIPTDEIHFFNSEHTIMKGKKIRLSDRGIEFLNRVEDKRPSTRSESLKSRRKLNRFIEQSIKIDDFKNLCEINDLQNTIRCDQNNHGHCLIKTNNKWKTVEFRKGYEMFVDMIKRNIDTATDNQVIAMNVLAENGTKILNTTDSSSRQASKFIFMNNQIITIL